jgi:hypothetical protein
MTRQKYMWTDFSVSQSEVEVLAWLSTKSPTFSLPRVFSLSQSDHYSMASMFEAISASVSMPTSTTMSQFSKFQLPYFLSSASKAATWTYTTVAILLALLALEQSVYRYKKKHIPGDKWTIPIIGKFADSMKPTMEGYMKQWNSGALSALSVFNMSASCLSSGLEIDPYSCLSVLLLWHPARNILARSSIHRHTQNPV